MNHIVIDHKRLASDRQILALILPYMREFARRQKHAYFKYKPADEPDRNQLAFHKSTADTRLVFGGSQSGKSRSVSQEAAWWLTGQHPYQKVPEQARIYAISASYRTLQEGIWRHLKSCLPEWMIEQIGQNVASWQIPSFVRMKNGSQIDFLSGEGGEDARRKVQAAEIDLGILDEEVDQLIWEELLARRLVRGGRIVVCATLIRSEPWCMDLEDKAETGDPDVNLVRLSTYAAQRAGHVKGAVIKQMEAFLSDDEREIRLLGKSRKSEGLIYPELGRKHVCEPFTIPDGWTRFCALDPGFRTFGVLWAAISPANKVFIYRELYLHAKHYLDVANAIFAAEGYELLSTGKWIWKEKRSERMEVRWIDPANFGHETSGEWKTGNLLSQYGLHCAPAQNDVETGIQVVRRALMDDMDGTPCLNIFRTCENLLKEMRTYRRHKEARDSARNQRTESPIKRNDHLCDTIRYLFLGGVYFKPEPDEWLVREKLEEMQELHGVRGTLPVHLAIKEEWQKLMKVQKEGEPQQSLAGLGSEY